MDTSLVDFEKSRLSWKRGSLSLLFHFTADKEKAAGGGTRRSRESRIKGSVRVVAMDHIHRVYTQLSKDDADDAEHQQPHPPPSSSRAEDLEDLEERIDDLMSSPLTAFTSPGVVEFVRQKAGIWGWRSDKVEDIHGYHCRVFDVKNLNLQTDKRVEHLTEEEREDLENMQKVMQVSEAELKQKLEEEHAQLASGEEDDGGDDGHQEVHNEAHALALQRMPEEGKRGELLMIEEPKKPHRHSLAPPPPPRVTYDEYFDGNAAFAPFVLYNPATQSHPFLHPPLLSRPHQTTSSKRTFSASVWMTDDFPLKTDTVVSLLDLVAPHQRHVEKVRNFLEQRLPPGFPMKVKVPIVPTVTAEVQFVEYSDAPIDDAMMDVPSDYTEDAQVFARFAAVAGQGEEDSGEQR